MGITNWGDDDTGLWLLDTLLPTGGEIFVLVESYFDESYSDDGEPLMCIAGYIIEKYQAIKLTKAWNRELYRYRLPYFHMVDCAHGNGVFANVTKQKRIALQTRMIEIIKQRTSIGLAISINPKEYEHLIPSNPLVGSCYSFCAHSIIAGARSWIERNPTARKMAYFFEAGHKSQSEANQIMNALFSLETTRISHRYAAHAFVEKKQSAAVQAADLLAWQWHKDRRRIAEGKPMRKDCESLLTHSHEAVHVDKKLILRVCNGLNQIAGWNAFNKGG